MSDEVARTLDQLERAYDGDAWHGPPLKSVLASVDADTAAQHPIAGAHSIRELVEHIRLWQDTVVRRLEGDSIDYRAGEDWPPADPAGPAAWADALKALDASHRVLTTAVRRLNAGQLADSVPGKTYSNYVMLHGLVQHTLYHAGQIALLQRAAGSIPLP